MHALEWVGGYLTTHKLYLLTHTRDNVHIAYLVNVIFNIKKKKIVNLFFLGRGWWETLMLYAIHVFQLDLFWSSTQILLKILFMIVMA